MMKIISMIALPLLVFQSCSSGPSHDKGLRLSSPDTLFKTSCYLAIDGNDTARMVLKSSDMGVKGKLLISYHDKDKNEGDFKGYFKGDTLLVDYGFRVGSKTTWYKNPLAFLQKDDQLLMGVGDMQNRWGRTYFVRGRPIDFKKGRFIFMKSDCLEARQK
jgi:hypothetical protein